MTIEGCCDVLEAQLNLSCPDHADLLECLSFPPLSGVLEAASSGRWLCHDFVDDEV